MRKTVQMAGDHPATADEGQGQQQVPKVTLKVKPAKRPAPAERTAPKSKKRKTAAANPYIDDEADDDDGLGGGSELVISGGLVAIGLTFTGISIATIANLMQEQCALGPTIIFEAGTTHPYYISPNLCTIGTHTYASKTPARFRSRRRIAGMRSTS